MSILVWLPLIAAVSLPAFVIGFFAAPTAGAGLGRRILGLVITVIAAGIVVFLVLSVEAFTSEPRIGIIQDVRAAYFMFSNTRFIWIPVSLVGYISGSIWKAFMREKRN